MRIRHVVGWIDRIDDAHNTKIRHPHQNTFHGRWNPKFYEPSDRGPMRLHPMQIQPQSIAAMKQHDKLHHPTEHIRNDRSERNSIEPQLRQSKPSPTEPEAEK